MWWGEGKLVAHFSCSLAVISYIYTLGGFLILFFVLFCVKRITIIQMKQFPVEEIQYKFDLNNFPNFDGFSFIVLF